MSASVDGSALRHLGEGGHGKSVCARLFGVNFADRSRKEGRALLAIADEVIERERNVGCRKEVAGRSALEMSAIGGGSNERRRLLAGRDASTRS
jgi:hypothetical protein